ncbi:hypothetical protein JNUCC0626_43150 [Lentzea sp. JNUCC 0626]|uniref:hypothetical protein n=1 Tax=Lentzea sp. JNUCC 0626 TaxID=3367513 RepID=UPI00374980B4
MVVAVFVLAGAPSAVAQPKTELHPCVPADLRESAITFKADDDVELPGLVFGSGSTGVLLAHTQTEFLCDWLPLARALADDGYQVLLYEMRSLTLRENRHSYDRDVLGAARELENRGASAIVAGGAGTGATAIASAGQQIGALKGMFLLTPFEAFRTSSADLDALTGIKAVQVPALVVAAEDHVVGDLRLADHAREIAGAASNAKLEIVPGTAGFGKLTEDAALRDEIRAFVRETAPPGSAAWSFTRWLLGGGTLLVVLAVVVVVLRRRNTTTDQTVS